MASAQALGSDQTILKIALIADTHANLPALNAVINDAQCRGVDEIWHLGDCLGYGPFPNETVALLKEKCVGNILGNYDEKVLKFKKYSKQKNNEKQTEKIFSFQWTDHALSPSSRRYLKSLPRELSLRRGKFSFLLVHGSPARNDEALSTDTSRKRLKELIHGITADVILCAHSHRAFDRRVDRTRYINPGSVGRPFDSDCRAGYALLEIQRGFLRARFVRLSYPIQETLGCMKKEKFSRGLIESIQLGRSLDEAQPKVDSEKKEEVLKEVFALVHAYQQDQGHVDRVCHLALQVFDALKAIHQMGDAERFYLRCAALLHDVGWAQGGQGHHKKSRDIILRAQNIPFDNQTRTLVALIARYHRKALPSNMHCLYKNLQLSLKKIVNVLASILRLADGLDAAYPGIDRVSGWKITKKDFVIFLPDGVSGQPQADVREGKTDLFSKVFKRQVLVRKSPKAQRSLDKADSA